jgi:hypothetical protein
MRVDVEFSESNISYALTLRDDIKIVVQKTNNIYTAYLILVSFFIHEYTHILRARNGNFKYINSNYYLNPEEMIAFHNQLSIESLLRKKDFKSCVEWFVSNNIHDRHIKNRFYNGIMRLHKKANLWYNTKKEFIMNKEIENSLRGFDSDMEKWEQSFGRQVQGLAEEERIEALQKFKTTIEEMRNSVIRQLEEYTKTKV